ncbi:MAG: ferrous iron transport protein A [Ferrovum sp.]|jgi:ferrous iron transport protein A|nr:ferrous iron transport protein A [Ferrovum sp.]NDU86987.1 ferrous iron transport protein A [Ferrovum sp.]
MKTRTHRVTHLAPGESGIIAQVSLDEGADSRLGEDGVRRLVELGFVPGEHLRVIRRGFPSGDPIAVRVGNSTFALRRTEAAAIKVTRNDES